MKNFKPGDYVLVQNTDKEGRWTKRGHIFQVTKGKNSYIINLYDGSVSERHCHHISDDKACSLYPEMTNNNQGQEDDRFEINDDDTVQSQEIAATHPTIVQPGTQIDDPTPFPTQETGAGTGIPVQQERQTQQVWQPNIPHTRSKGPLPNSV